MFKQNYVQNIKEMGLTAQGEMPNENSDRTVILKTVLGLILCQRPKIIYLQKRFRAYTLRDAHGV